MSVLRNFEDIHHQFDHGTISKETWIGWSNRITSFLSQPGAAEWWNASQQLYSPKFRAFIAAEKARSIRLEA